MPLPEPIQADLDAIDAALAGDAVAPEFADLAELALLLSDARPAVPDPVATRLDRRVGGLAADRRTRRRLARAHRDAERSHRPWLLRPAYGAGLAGVAGVVVAVVLLTGHGGRSVVAGTFHGSAGSSSALHAQSSAATASAATSTAPALGSLAAPPSAGSSRALSPALPTPAANGQKLVQSSQLSLTAPADRIDQVAQELFDVVGAEQGLVKHSSVTAGDGGFASFTLSIPTANLPVTLSRLAALKYSRVTSSTESTTDVTDSYQDDRRRLADAKALHTSLLRQLAAAVTTEQADSLDAQIKDDEATITGDETALNGLHSEVSYTTVSVQINPGVVVTDGRQVGGAGTGGGGFTLHKAGHDALRVLIVAAGVLLIAVAVLVPLALVIGLGLWVRRAWQRRRREGALDAA